MHPGFAEATFFYVNLCRLSLISRWNLLDSAIGVSLPKWVFAAFQETRISRDFIGFYGIS